MIVFIITLIIAGSIIYVLKDDKDKIKSSSTSFKNIAKTEMMADMYKDITGKKLDEVEKSILFMHNSNNKK